MFYYLQAVNHLSLVDPGSEVEVYVKKHCSKSTAADEGTNNNAKNVSHSASDQTPKEVSFMQMREYFLFACISIELNNNNNDNGDVVPGCVAVCSAESYYSRHTG